MEQLDFPADWRRTAKSKRAALFASFPPGWRLASGEIPPVSRLKDVVQFISRYLTPLELQITNEVPIRILENVRNLNWSAVEVTQAFCHRAALAHQLVRWSDSQYPMANGYTRPTV